MPDQRSTVEVLKAARERISDRRRWCKGDYAQRAQADGWSSSAPPADMSARRWCSVGAIYAEVGDDPRLGFQGAEIVLNEAAIALGFDSAIHANDTGHDAALRVYDRAIELAEAPTPELAEAA